MAPRSPKPPSAAPSKLRRRRKHNSKRKPKSSTRPNSSPLPPRVRHARIDVPVVRERSGHRDKRHRVGQNILDLLGGKEGVLSLLPPDPNDSRASALRDALNSPQAAVQHFDTLYLSAGYSAKDLFDLFDSRQHATALIVASEAKPRLVGELVDAASQRIVPCASCGGTMRVARVDPDGGFLEWERCGEDHCDDRGNVLVDGNKAARELYFDQFGFRQSAPLVSVDARQDNRRVEFHVGQPGTAPSPLALIRALEQVPDIGAPKQLAEPAAAAEQQRVMSGIVEAEVTER